MENLRAVDPVFVTLLDGKQYEILLTLGSIRRLRRLTTENEASYDGIDSLVDILAEGLRVTHPDLSKDKDAIADLVDAKGVDQIRKAYEAAMGKTQGAATELAGAEPDPKAATE